ncbi:MAG TPA: hypothetical protein VGN13_12425 [Solirubrobacteraceae bacterium]
MIYTLMLDEVPLESRHEYRQKLEEEFAKPLPHEAPQDGPRELEPPPEAPAEAERQESAWDGETHDGGVP